MISIVDDDESIRRSTQSLLRSAGYEVRTFACADDLMNSGTLEKTECLILDVRMPGVDGLQLQKRLKDDGLQIPVIFVTAYADVSTRERALQAGAVDLLHKPVDAAFFLTVVQIAVGDYRRSQNFYKQGA